MKIEELELSIRTENLLRSLRIATVADLLSLSARDLLKTKNCEKKTLIELRTKLASLGLLLKEDVLITDRQTIELLANIKNDIELFLEKFPKFKDHPS